MCFFNMKLGQIEEVSIGNWEWFQDKQNIDELCHPKDFVKAFMVFLNMNIVFCSNPTTHGCDFPINGLLHFSMSY